MKTPVSVLLTAILYWLGIFAVFMIPQFSRNYEFNLIWLTVVIPNVLRLIVNRIPRLAVDRIFFFASTIISLIATYFINRIWNASKQSVKNPDTDARGKRILVFLLMSTFAGGALVTYFAGIDNSIYSNLGWER
jgi:hypothetical protein